MNGISKFSRLALTATALAAAAACVPAAAQSFSVDEGTVPGATAATVNAAGISFNYSAIIDQTLNGATYDGDDPFTESGFLTKASFTDGMGTAVPSQLNASPAFAPAGYGIYGLFTIDGTAAQDGSGIHATFSSATLQLYIDPGQDTTLSFVGNTATTGGATGDDYVIASYTLASGEAHVFGGLANGDFDTILNLTLSDDGSTSDGESYFSSPSPFYTLENFGGNTQRIDGASLTESFVATASGAGVELFLAPVPEPETYALMLAGLGALGFVARRRRPS